MFKASGNVELTFSGVSVRANSIQMNMAGESDEAVAEFAAEGNVVLSRGGEHLSFERLQFNPRTGTGTFQLTQATK